jgi:hypothetical protein
VRRSSSGRRLGKAWLSLALVLVCLLALAAPLQAGADPDAEVTLSPGLLAAAQAEPGSTFSVIVQGEAGAESVTAEVEDAVAEEGGTAVADSFVTVPGVAATLRGYELVALAESSEPLVITLDAPLTAADAPTNTGAPSIAGTAEAGAALTVEAGVWSGTPPLAYSFQWQRCAASGADCQDIAAATGGTYTLEAADVGSAVRVVVTATGSEGSATASSASTAVVAGAGEPVVAPVSAADPRVSGLEEPGQVLSATSGAWTGGGELAYSFQWQRCTKRYRDEAVAADAPLGFWRLSENGGQVAADASGHGLGGAYGASSTSRDSRPAHSLTAFRSKRGWTPRGSRRSDAASSRAGSPAKAGSCSGSTRPETTDSSRGETGQPIFEPRKPRPAGGTTSSRPGTARRSAFTRTGR